MGNRLQILGYFITLRRFTIDIQGSEGTVLLFSSALNKRLGETPKILKIDVVLTSINSRYSPQHFISSPFLSSIDDSSFHWILVDMFYNPVNIPSNS